MAPCAIDLPEIRKKFIILTRNEPMKPSSRIFLYPGWGPNGQNVFTVGTFEDLRTDGITPVDGMSLSFYCDDADVEGNDDPLLFEGTIHYNSQLGKWYALVDETTYHHASDELKKS